MLAHTGESGVIRMSMSTVAMNVLPTDDNVAVHRIIIRNLLTGIRIITTIETVIRTAKNVINDSITMIPTKLTSALSAPHKPRLLLLLL